VGHLRVLDLNRNRPPRTSKSVLAITVVIAYLGETRVRQPNCQSKQPPRGVKRKQGNWSRACNISSRRAASRSNSRIGSHGRLDRSSRLRRYQSILRAGSGLRQRPMNRNRFSTQLKPPGPLTPPIGNVATPPRSASGGPLCGLVPSDRPRLLSLMLNALTEDLVRCWCRVCEHPLCF